MTAHGFYVQPYFHPRRNEAFCIVPSFYTERNSARSAFGNMPDPAREFRNDLEWAEGKGWFLPRQLAC